MHSWKHILLLFILISSCNKPDLTPFFNGMNGTMVIYNQNDDDYTTVNEKRAKTRYPPFSTFKIPNSIIALETGVVPNIDSVIQCDNEKYPEQDWWMKNWRGKHNLRSAIKYSVVPVYRTIATKVGLQRMQKYIESFDYGSKQITTDLDIFWLDGGIKISAMEQIIFLKKFFNNDLGINYRTTELVKSIIVQEETNRYKLSYKTGGGYLNAEKTKALGWLVGYVEKENNVYFFAMNIEGDTFDEIAKPRIEISKNVLKELDII